MKMLSENGGSSDSRGDEPASSSSLDMLLSAAVTAVTATSSDDEGKSDSNESVRQELASSWTTSPEPNSGPQAGPIPARPLPQTQSAGRADPPLEPGAPPPTFPPLGQGEGAAPSPVQPNVPTSPTPGQEERAGCPLELVTNTANSSTLEYHLLIQLMLKQDPV